MVRLRRRWLRRNEEIRWDALANRGPGDTRQVGGRLYVTDQRLVFQPGLLERFADARRFEVPTSRTLKVGIGPGNWTPKLRVLRPLALRYDVTVTPADGDEEHFFVTHIGEPLAEMAAHDLSRAPDRG